MAKITYNDKVALITNPDIADENKVTDNDMNEIKQVVNENDDKFLTNGLNVSNEVDNSYRVNLLHSKNLWKQLPTTQTLNGITLTNNGNGTFNLRGTATANTSFYAELDLGSTNLKNGTYTLSKKSAGYNIQLDFYNGTTYVSTPIYCYGSTLENSATLSIGSSVNKVRFIIYIANGSSVSLTNEHIMLNSGSTALPYKAFIQNQIVVDDIKYSDTLNVGQFDSRSRVNVLKSNNLLEVNLSKYQTTKVSGVNNTDNGDQTITINGTQAQNTNLYLLGNGTNTILNLKANKTYTFKLYMISGSMSGVGGNVIIGITGNANYVYKAFTSSSNNVEIQITPTNDINITSIRLYSTGGGGGQTYTNLKLKAQINEGSTATSYEPYITPSINVDGEEIYSKDNLGLVKTKQLGITFSSSGTNIILTIPVDLLDNGTILINGTLAGIDAVILNFIISYASRYSYEIISKRGTNIGNDNITTSYSNSAIVITIPFVSTNMPKGIGTVKASMIYLG